MTEITLHFVCDGSWIIRDLIRIGNTQRSICHVLDDILRHRQDLRRFCTIDAIEVRIILEAVIPGSRKNHGYTLNGGSVGNRATLPFDDSIGTEVKLELTTMVRGNHVTTRSLAGLYWIVCGLAIDQFIETSDMLLWRDSPDSRRRRCRIKRD